MILYWIIFILYIAFAFKDIKHAVIAWIPIHCLFNSAVVLWGFSPVLGLTEAISLSLPLIYLYKRRFTKDIQKYYKGPFLFKSVFLLYLFSYGISTLLSQYNTQQTLLYSLKFFVNAFLLVYLFQQCLTSMKDIKFLLCVSVVVLGMAVALGISELLLGFNIWSDFVWLTSPLSTEELFGRTFCMPSFLGEGQRMRLGVARIYSFFNLHLNFGSFCAIMLFFIGILWKNGVVLWKKWVMPLSILLCYIGAFICNSKGPLLLAIVLTPIVFTPKQIFNPKLFFPIAGIIIIVLFMFPQLIEVYINSLLSIGDEELAQEAGGSSVELRQQQLSVALRLFLNNPIFGSGPQSLRAISNTSEGAGILGAESIWLKTLPELGIIGIAAFLFFYWTAFSKLKTKIPFWEAFIILAGIGLIETTNGRRDMLLYVPMLITIRLFYIIQRSKKKRKKVKKDNEESLQLLNNNSTS